MTRRRSLRARHRAVALIRVQGSREHASSISKPVLIGGTRNERSMLDVSRFAAAAVFLTSGTLHFARPELFRAIVPPGLPNPGALVAISGAAELAGALGLWPPATRRWAAAGLVGLLVRLRFRTFSPSVPFFPFPVSRFDGNVLILVAG